jgi:phage protein D
MSPTTFIVEAPGPLPPSLQKLPVHVRVEDGNRMPSAATLRYRDPERMFLRESGIRIGVPLRITARRGSPGVALPLFSGEVVALEAEFDGTGSFTTVRAFDRGHRLQRGRKVAAYPNMTASDIARKLALGAGLPLGTIDPTPTTYTLASQPDISDWDFLQALAEDNGVELTVADGLFHFRHPLTAATAPPGDLPTTTDPAVLSMTRNVLSVRSHVTSVDQVGRVQVRGWSADEKRALLGEAEVTESRGALIGLSPQSADVFGDHSLAVTDMPFSSDAAVTAVAESIAADVAASLAELEVVVRGDPSLRSGVAVTLTGAGEPFDGKYTVTASRHLDRPGGGYETWLTVGGRQNRTAHGLAAGALAAARSPRIPGVAIGIVTDTTAPANGAEQGWVRLKFPWLSGEDALGSSYVSDWVRTVQLGGVGGGGVISPDVNDEVLVAFDHGLLDRPYVIGGLYNGHDKPSPNDIPLVDETSGKVGRRTLATRAGDRIELLDTADGTAGVRLRTSDGKLVLYLDRQQTAITVQSDGTVSVTAAKTVMVKGEGITLDAGDGALTLTGGSVTVSGKSVSLDGQEECAITAPSVKLN